MREIKFRGIDSETNEWRYGCLRYGFTMSSGYQIISTHITTNMREGTDEWFEEREVRIETVGQYTGLKDKTGKEIYEADKIQRGNIAGFVEWSNHKAGWCLDNGNNLHFAYTNECEIIGNKYEN